MDGAKAAMRTATGREPGAGSSTSPALPRLLVAPIPQRVARELLGRHHYLHSLPGGTQLAFGVFLGRRLLGALTLGVGPANAHRLVGGARAHNCLTLSRLWLSDELPANSESQVLGSVLRALKRETAVKFLISYADPSAGHVGTIYQATNWLYTDLSATMSLYDIGDGKARHSRSLSHAYGTHSTAHFQRQGVAVSLVPQAAKHRYFYFLDPSWRSWLRLPVLPYPKKDAADAGR